MVKKLGWIVFVLCFNLLNAQEQEVVVFEVNGDIVSNLKVKIEKEKDTIVLVTNLKGKLLFPIKIKENINLIINDLRYSYYEEEIEASNVLKTIYLEKSNTIDEVVFQTKKKNISRSFGTTTLKIDDSPIFQNSSFSDLVELIPEVTKENGKMKILGKSKTLYLINGRETRRSISDLGAHQIEKIEVISNPSAKYSASYDSVMNVVLKKNKEIGWYLNLNSNTFFNRINSYSNSIDIGVNKNKWAIHTSLKYDLSNALVYNHGWQEYTDKYEDYNSQSRSKKRYIESSTNFNYRVDSKNDIGLDFNLGSVPKNNSKNERSSDFTSFKTGIKENINSIAEENSRKDFVNTNMYHRYSQKNHSLNSYFGLIYNKQSFDKQISSENNTEILLDQDVVSGNDAKTYIFNTDYEWKINEKNQIETGLRTSNFKGTYRLNTFNFGNHNSNTSFDFMETIYSMYGVYKSKINKFDLSAGLRYEYFDRDVAFNQSEKKSSNKGELFPSLSIAYKNNKTKESIQLSYAKKIQRPNFNAITPFEYSVNYNTIFRGNPNLKNEIKHSVQLYYINKKKFYFIPYFNLYKNYMEDVAVFENNNLVWYPSNYDRQNYGSNFMYIFKMLNKKVTLYNKLDVRYEKNIGNINGVDLNTSIWKWSLYFAQVYQLNKKIGITMVTNYYSPELSDFYEIKQGLKTDLKISTKIWKNKINASISIRDLFNTYNNKLTGNVNGIKSYRESDFSTRSLILSLRYNFQSGKKSKINPMDIDNSEEKNRITK